MFWIILATALICIAGTVHAQASYDPSAFISAMDATSLTANYNDWGADIAQFQQLQQVCQNIESQYSSLSTSAQSCIEGASLVINGSECYMSCRPSTETHTTQIMNGILYGINTISYGVAPTGATVSRGLADINEASTVLSY